MSSAPHATFNSLEALSPDVDGVMNVYEDDKFFELVLKMMQGEKITDEAMHRKVEKVRL